MSKRTPSVTDEPTGAAVGHARRHRTEGPVTRRTTRPGGRIIPKPPTREEIEATVKLLHSWRENDVEEQRETWEYLRNALDEDRPSSRKLFP